MAEADKQQAMMRIQELYVCVLSLTIGGSIFLSSPGADPLSRALPLFVAAGVAGAVLVGTRVLLPMRPGAAWPMHLLRLALLLVLIPVEWRWGGTLPPLPLLYTAIVLLGFWQERPWGMALAGALAGVAHGVSRWLTNSDPATEVRFASVADLLTPAVLLPATLVAVTSSGIGLVLLTWVRMSRESARLTEQRLAAAERLAATGTLAAMAAHEIRGPLTSVKGFLQMLQRRLRGQEDGKWVELIRRDVGRVERLVREFLILGSPRPPRPVLTPVLPLLEDSVRAALMPDPGREALDVTIACKPELEWPLDREHLRQVLVNLLRNAAEATQSHGRITIAASEDDGVLSLTVTDNGSGIPEEQLNQVLEPFFTTKRTGTGLGLAICQQLIANHGGMLSVESAGGEGTTVTVRLGKQPPLPEEVPRPAASITAGRTARARVAPLRSAATAAERLKLMGRQRGNPAPHQAAVPAPAPRVQEGPQ